MSKQSIKQTIDDNIYQNGQQRITGVVMNSVLKEMVDNEYDELDEKPDIKDSGNDADLDLADEEGNVLVRFKDGGVKTKHFDSITTPEIGVDGNNDLSIVDNDNNAIVVFRNGHIKTRNFDSSNIIPVSGVKKKIKALFIGNSVSQDHITYLPYLLKNTYGDELDFELGIFYIGGYTIKQYVNNVIPKTKNADIWSVAHNEESWTNSSNVTLESALKYADWDVISMEGYYNNPENEDTTLLPTLVKYFQEHTNKPFEFGWLMHQTFKGTDVETAIKNGASVAIQNNPVSLLFPPYYVTQYAKSFMTTSEITPDNTHNREGLPCIMGAYSVMKVLCNLIGLPCKVLGNPLRIDAAKYETLNIPGSNGSIVSTTEEQWEKSQVAAIKAINASIGLWNSARNEMYNI